MKADVGSAVRFVAIVLVALGCFLRFCDLGAKLFWHDETYTGLAIAGSSFAEIRAALLDGRDHRRQELLAHQFPRGGKNTVDTIRAMAEYQPRHPPLYFVLARGWTILFGPSITSLRAFSAFLGLLSLPLVFLLCRELDDDRLFRWIAVSLVAISPLHLVYAQEARQYLLWIDLLLLASWLLLVATRLGTEDARWARTVFGLYAGVLAMSLYTHLLSVLVVGAHALFVLATERARKMAVLSRFAGAFAVASVLFLPWIYRLVADFHTQRAWVAWAAMPVSPNRWMLRTAAAWSRPFLDLEQAWVALGAIPLGLAATSVVWVMFQAPRRVKWFLIPLAVLGTLPFVTADLLCGGFRSGVIRFQFPAVLAIQLCVACALSYFLRSPHRARYHMAITATLLFAVSGVVSDIAYVRAPVWWNKATARELFNDAQQLNLRHAPLLISSEHGHRSLGDLIALVHLLDEDVILRLVIEPTRPQRPTAAEDTYVWGVSDAMLDWLAADGWELERVGVYQLHRLVRLRDK